MPRSVSAALLDVANVPRVASRLRELAASALAAAEAIEAESPEAAALAVDLRVIVTECQLIGRAAEGIAA